MEIPGYRIERRVAEGGMASVYLAVQESLDRRVALKILKKFDTPGQSERFVNEGRIIASLNHRNIITIHDIGAVEGRHYISMEYLTGGDLEQRIREGMPPETAIGLTLTLGRCLEFLHGKGIIHRDIKPANILFRHDETPILTDFGIAKQMHLDTSLTMDGTAVGSPDYLSPEQAECKPLDGRTDIYSLGIVLYEMLTGEKPYQGNSYIETAMAHITAPIPDLPRHLKRYQELVDRMIAKNPSDRFASAAEMTAHLDGIDRAGGSGKARETLAGLVSRLHKPDASRPAPAPTLEMPSPDRPHAAPDTGHGTEARAPASPTRKSGRAAGYLLLAGGVLAAVATAFLLDRPAPPEATPQAGSDTRVEAHLERARIALRSDRLTAPEKDNAFFHFREALALEPANEEALRGLSEIAGHYADRAVSHLSASEFAAAEAQIATGLRVQPYNPRLIALRKERNERVNAEIEQHLLQAKAAIESDRLTTPPGDNAYFHYREVLALSPGHEEAVRGLGKIADRYADLAEWNIDEYNYSEAKTYVRRGLDVQPDHPRLLALRERTSALKDVPGRIIKGIKSVFD